MIIVIAWLKLVGKRLLQALFPPSLTLEEIEVLAESIEKGEVKEYKLKYEPGPLHMVTLLHRLLKLYPGRVFSIQRYGFDLLLERIE